MQARSRPRLRRHYGCIRRAGTAEGRPGRRLRCADGSEFSSGARGEPGEGCLHLQHGGACFSAETLRVRARPLQHQRRGRPEREGWHLDSTDERNPLCGLLRRFVPYCTGDVFVGNTTREYAQASPSTTRGTPGSGPGLAIVRQIADSHGGRVEVESAAPERVQAHSRRGHRCRGRRASGVDISQLGVSTFRPRGAR